MRLKIRWMRLLIKCNKHGKRHTIKINMILDDMHINGIGW